MDINLYDDSLSQFLRVYPDALTQEQCDKLIAFCDNSETHKGPVYKSDNPGASIDLSMKDADQVHVPKGSNEDIMLFNSLGTLLNRYTSEFDFYPTSASIDQGYQIQRYEIDQGHFEWHTDASSLGISKRIIVALWYLNDVEEGGETEFGWGEKIKPTAGSAIIFPSNWLYAHKGHKPISNRKYIATTWIGF